ncbi:hypothetical protein GALLR39Z86_43510 [Glycomyces algeriensis]|uniref:Uncharacterized protein n=1 Tax=Glycomyces algeriensis TaxID=256037 RepID=A0A9W6GCQ5_9ACTN|nr:hypothetical protein GALLR39Z86_43510 [Glycomyces algeriensis]
MKLQSGQARQIADAPRQEEKPVALKIEVAQAAEPTDEVRKRGDPIETEIEIDQTGELAKPDRNLREVQTGEVQRLGTGLNRLSDPQLRHFH